MEELLAVLQRERISEDGLKAVKECGVDLGMFRMFLDAGIGDVFKVFKDRFLIRQYLKRLRNQQEVGEPSGSIVQVNLDNSVVSETGSTTNEDINTFGTCATLELGSQSVAESEDMIATKGLRGRPNDAQKYCQIAGIVRDAAKVAKIWKKTPQLCEIPGHKKDIFFTALGSVCPELLNYRREVWTCLAKKFQNRRKYMADKVKGKRSTKSQSHLDHPCAPLASTSSVARDPAPATSVSSQTVNNIQPGDVVEVRSTDGRTLGQGLFLRRASSMYAEVSLKTVVKENLHEGDELPERSGAACLFSQLKEKQMFTWKFSNLHKKPTSKQIPTPKATSSTSSARKQTQLKFRTLHKNENSSVSSPTLQRHNKQPSKPAANSIRKEFDESASTSTSTSTSSSSPETIVAMEWNNGKVLLGLRTRSGRSEEVTSCLLPVAKIQRNDLFVLARNDLKKGLTLNKSDVQRRPNAEYLVWIVPNDVCELSQDKKYLKLKISDETFFEQFDVHMSQNVKF